MMTSKICQAASIAFLLQFPPTLSFTSNSIIGHSIPHNSQHDGLRIGSDLQYSSSKKKQQDIIGLRNDSKTRTQLRASSIKGDDTASSMSACKENIEEVVKDEFEAAFLVNFELPEHKPLGCTVEETVVQECNHVFVSKIVPGGCASQAGLKVGDVIVAVNELFGPDLALILNSGLDQIKSMIGSVPEEETLRLSIARGTDVMENHEEFLVELCSMAGANDKMIEGSITNYLSEGYYNEKDPSSATSYDDDEEDIVIEDDDNIIDDVFNLWAGEVPPPPSTTDESEKPKEEPVKKIKPWSSRSSPSGTYVRDPVTGEMKNIDSTDWSNGVGSS